MLQHVKIDRETTAQCELVAKRMQRKQNELFTELMHKDRKHSDHLAQLDDEIARIEGDLTFATLKDEHRRRYEDKHIETLKAHTLLAPAQSLQNVFLRTSSRCASERVPAQLQVGRDDILLERVGYQMPLGSSPMLSAAAASRGGGGGVAVGGANSSLRVGRRSASAAGGAAAATPVRGGTAGTTAMGNASLLSVGGVSMLSPSRGGGLGGMSSPPLPSLDGRSPYRKRGGGAATPNVNHLSPTGGGGHGGGRGSSQINNRPSSAMASMYGGKTTNTATTPQKLAKAGGGSASPISPHATVNPNASYKPKETTVVADERLIYNDTPYMTSVGRMRSSSPAALQQKIAAATTLVRAGGTITSAKDIASPYHHHHGAGALGVGLTSSGVGVGSNSPQSNQRALRGGSGKQQPHQQQHTLRRINSATAFCDDDATEAEAAAQLSAILLKRTTIEGEPLDESDDERLGGGSGMGTNRYNNHHLPPRAWSVGGLAVVASSPQRLQLPNSSAAASPANAPTPSSTTDAPPLEALDERPWTTRSTHGILIRDPYMRKYKLHRYDTHLHSERFKNIIRSANTPKKIVERDGCDFNYRGNLSGEGMERGNMSYYLMRGDAQE